MVLGERSKVRIRGIKGRLEKRERDLFALGDPGKRKKREEKPERKERKRGFQARKTLSS